MKVSASTAFAILSAAGFAAAHMEMKDPPPLRSKFNKAATSVDFDMTSPLAPSGANFPCKGYLGDLGTPAGKAVADWTPGQPQSLTIVGGASHNGGSCQASLSYDNGKTFKVIHSWVGKCPLAGESKFEFTVPSDAPAGAAVFAWSWFNQVGNREMYMNCASVNIGGAGKKKRGSTQSFSSRPDMFVANVGKGCGTTEGTDLMFPNPGPDVDMSSQKTSPPTGSCAGSSPDGSSPAPGNDKPSSAPSKSQPASFSAPKSSASSVTKPAATKFPNVNNGQNSPPAPTTVVQKPSSSAPASAPTTTPDAPPQEGGSCNPGAFGCSFDATAMQVCNVSQNWTRVVECGAGRVCKVNDINKTPYCVSQ